MAYYSNHNLAYDFTLFEEERKAPTAARGRAKAGDKPVKADSKEKVNKAAAEKPASARKSGIKRLKRRKANFLRIGAGVLLGAVVVFMIASIIHGRVQLTELTQEVRNARVELSEKEGIYSELEMKVEAAISNAAVEEYAQENLHMTKASNSQKEFISLSSGDKAEVILSENKNIFEKMFDAIASLWS